MLALGLSLLVSVAAAPPATAAPAHEQQLASTYEEAACDPGDGGECAEEAIMDLMPAPPTILDCESPLIAQMIGSCDMPAPALPTLHVPTLRNAGGGIDTALSDDDPGRLHVVATASSVDGAMPVCDVSLYPAPLAAELTTLYAARWQELPRSRLDRPPRV